MPSPRGAPVGGMSEGQGEIPLLGEMSAKRTKGSAVFAEEAASGEEKVSPQVTDEGLTCPNDYPDKEYETYPRFSVRTQSYRILHQPERDSPHPTF